MYLTSIMLERNTLQDSLKLGVVFLPKYPGAIPQDFSKQIDFSESLQIEISYECRLTLGTGGDTVKPVHTGV